MPKAPKNETYEQKKERYLQAGYNIARTLKQNKNEDGTLKVTEDDLWFSAHKYMEKQMERESEKGRLKTGLAERYALEDEEYRQEQEKKYLADFEWNTSNDLAALDHLVNLEVQIRQIRRDLAEPFITQSDKDKARKTLNDTIREHRGAMASLGIDRPAREKKLSAGDPVQDWERIKEEALLKKEMQRAELVDRLEEIENEAQLRDALKYGLLQKFDIIDPILLAHRRVLGLPLELEKS